jgi:hypothetical protein
MDRTVGEHYVGAAGVKAVDLTVVGAIDRATPRGASVGIRAPNHEPAEKGFPGTAEDEVVAERLRDQDNGKRIFSRFEWGEYLGWALSPRSKVFMDGRIEIFPDEVWADFEAVTRGRGDWEAILELYDVDCLLVDRSGFHADLLPQVERAPEKWERVCDAGDAVLFVRRSSRAGGSGCGAFGAAA